MTLRDSSLRAEWTGHIDPVPSECEWSVLSGQEPNQQGVGGGTLLFSLS